MPFDRFMIAPLKGGVQKDLKPWLISEDAFEQLTNAYIFRGRIRKRFGARLLNGDVATTISQQYSRLRIQIGSTNASGEFSFTALPGEELSVGAQFSVGAQYYTVTTVPALVGNATTLSTIGTSVGTVRLDSTGPNVYQFRLVGVTPSIASLPVYWYPSNPVMGFITYNTSGGQTDPTYAFDTQFAYQYTAGAWARLGTQIWTGSDAQFFWGANFQKADGTRLLFVTNNNYDDGINYWNGATWAALNPVIDGSGNTLDTCLLLVSYQGRLIALNTTENAVNFQNRARWSGPAFGDPTAVNAWNTSIAGNGNYIDAATNEAIVSCCFVKDRLIVFFERSTWALVYTNNQAQPFTWQLLNIELGADATYSPVAFDKVALAIGNVGIHACNGVNVERIDNKIPDEVWNIHVGSSSVNRVAGIRDYFAQQVYWTFPNIDTNTANQTYPNQILVFNYETGTWAINTDSITAFGYFYESDDSAITWDDLDTTWDSETVSWGSGEAQPLSQEVIAGNQQGFTFICDSNKSSNDQSLQITNITASGTNVVVKCINHNLDESTRGTTRQDSSQEGDYVQLNNLNGLSAGSGGIYPVVSVVDSDTIIVLAPTILARLQAGDVYTGGGTITRISRIDIYTKQFNFYVDQDRNAYIQKVDFLVDRTDNGQVTVDYLLGSSQQGNLQESLVNGVNMGDGTLVTTPLTLYPQESRQERLWHPIYLQADANGIQLRIFLSNDQLADELIAKSPLQIHAFCIYTVPTSSRLQ